jgi:hypothetical protein
LVQKSNQNLIFISTKRKNMKRYILKSLLSLVVPFALVSFTLVADKANFGGNWALNEGKSELGDFGGRVAARKLKVDQKGDGITVARTSPGFNGGEDVTRTETLTFDGKATESTNTGGFGTSKRKSTIKWAGDEKSFAITYNVTFEGNDGPIVINGTETWTLSADGKVLTIETKSTSPQGEFTVKGVYDKQ